MADSALELAKLAEASGDPDAFQIVYSKLMASYASSARVAHMTTFADEVAAFAVQALRRAGRLKSSPAVGEEADDAGR